MNFNNNNLLNQTYMNNMQNLNMFNRGQMNNLNQLQMMNMYQTMNNLKKMQESKILSKINELEKNRDRLNLSKDELRNAIIKPIKIEKSDKQEIVIKYKDLEKNFTKKELEDLWSKRTNMGYKNIIKDDIIQNLLNSNRLTDDEKRELYEKYNKREYKSKKDLIVHKVTDLDKLGVDKELQDFESKIETQNGELKIQYSQSHELEHKKKFEYNNKYKYAAKYNPKAHEDLKDDNVEYFKKEQEKLEKDKKKVDDVIQSLLSSNILSEDEKKELSEIDENNKVDIKESKAEKEVKPILKNTKDKESLEEQTKKPIKITIKTKKVDENISENKSDNNETGKVDDDTRNKYLSRKKK